MKPAFSTVACPDWTLAQVADAAEAGGYLGVELRTFGTGSTSFACDPALSDPAKVRAMFDRAGVTACSVATSVYYSAPVYPPVIGHVFGDHEVSIRQTKSAVELAANLESPMVRVFPYHVPPREKRANTLRRINARLDLAIATARNTGVRLALENAGDFSAGLELATIIEGKANSLLGACYDVSAGRLAGDDVERVVGRLGNSLLMVRVRDFAHGQPCLLGEGELRVAETLDILSAAGFRGWVVYEHDKAWLPGAVCSGMPATTQVLHHAAEFMFRWVRAGAKAPARV